MFSQSYLDTRFIFDEQTEHTRNTTYLGENFLFHPKNA